MIEQLIHITVVKHLEARAIKGLYWFHPANGEKRNIVTAKRLKRMGVKPGIADLVFVLPFQGCGSHGVVAFMEIKSEKGRLSPKQKEFRDKCARLGWSYKIVRNLDEAIYVLRQWGALKN